MPRYIDAEKLKELRHNYIQGKLDFNGNEYDLIDKCPTADVQEVVHAAWVWKEFGDIYGGVVLCCSECLETEGAHMGYDYCPNCGAKMDKENK